MVPMSCAVVVAVAAAAASDSLGHSLAGLLALKVALVVPLGLLVFEFAQMVSLAVGAGSAE